MSCWVSLGASGSTKWCPGTPKAHPGTSKYNCQASEEVSQVAKMEPRIYQIVNQLLARWRGVNNWIYFAPSRLGQRTVRFKGKKSQARKKIKEAFRLTVCSSFKQRVGLWPWLLVCQPTPGNGNDWPSRFARPAFNAFEHRGLCSNRWSHSNHMCMARFPRFANILPLDFLQPCALLSRQLHTRPSKELKVTVCATSF